MSIAARTSGIRSSRTTVALGAVAAAGMLAAGQQGLATAAGPSQADRAAVTVPAPVTMIGLGADGTSLSSLVLARNGKVTVTAAGSVSGLQGDTRLVGIDARVQDGGVYGVGESGGIYTLGATGAATKVSQLTVPLTGTAFGVDFNPAANRLRVVSNFGQNLRHNVDDPAAPTTTTRDGLLTYTPAGPQGVAGAAYTNNDLDPATGTTLFDIDIVLDSVAVQTPANAGSLTTTAKLGVNASTDAGFDIATVGGEERGFATMRVGRSWRLVEISLLGKAELVVVLPQPIADITVPIPAGTPVS